MELIDYSIFYESNINISKYYMKIAIINKIRPKIIDILNSSVVLLIFFKSQMERDRAYIVNRTKGTAKNPYKKLNKP